MNDLKPNLFLTEEQIAFFHREGYLAVNAITTQEEIARLKTIYDRLFQQRAGREDGYQFDLAGTDEEEREAVLPQILEPVKYAPELEHIQFRLNAASMARQLLGAEAKPLGEHAIFKPPSVGAATPWHQDEAYWEEEFDFTSLSVWMPLQEATVENGCMQFIPGSHKLEVLPHHTIRNDPRIHGLVVDEVNPSTSVDCPLPAGGATFHHCRTLHYTGPNVSDIPRRAYILIFGLEPKRRQGPRNFYWNKIKQTASQERRRASQEKAMAKNRRSDSDKR
jgi:ectoine hydroxylase-related dioxygenase (phytanoyl-CoA dioxygenase family)